MFDSPKLIIWLSITLIDVPYLKSLEGKRFRWNFRAYFYFSHADGPLDVPWEATRVDNQRIWQEGIWQRMSGHVKFLDGKYTAYIQFDFPAKTKVTGNIEEAEIRLYNPRANDSCVKIDAERHVRTFSIRYIESEIIDRGSMSLQRGAKWMVSSRIFMRWLDKNV